MILFDLCCKNKHIFEAWFPSSKKFEEQIEKKLIKCPICDTANVKKALMAPNVATSNKGKENIKLVMNDKEDLELKKEIKKIKKFLEKNTENVGNNFAEEARKIYYGEAKAKSIRGQTTDEEAKRLEEEGIPFTKLPWSNREDA